MLQKIIDGRTDLVFDYIAKGHGVFSQDQEGHSLLKWCAYYGDVSAIKFLLSKGADLNDLGSNLDLNGAAFHGHWQLCQYLLEQGADANYALPHTGETALHSCLCMANRPVTNLIVELLLAFGADPNHRTKAHAETGGFMRDAYTRQETALHRAAAFGNETTIQLLLNAGADKKIKDMNGDSPLSWASWHLRPASILSLLTYGPHRINPAHLERMKSDHGCGWGSGTSISRQGQLHLESGVM